MVCFSTYVIYGRLIFCVMYILRSGCVITAVRIEASSTWCTYGTTDVHHGIVCMLRTHETELNDPVVTAVDTDDG